MLLSVLAALVLIIMIAGCSPSQSSPSADEGTDSAAMPTEAGAYVSDEQCMSCHGDSYEAVAERTSGLGDWNPHDSIHGGYNSCNNCHDADQVLSHNYCAQCHVYAPSEEPLY